MRVGRDEEEEEDGVRVGVGPGVGSCGIGLLCWLLVSCMEGELTFSLLFFPAMH